MKKIINLMLFLGLVSMLCTIAAAEGDYKFKQGYNSTIRFPVYLSDGSLCSSCAINLTVNYPNGTSMLSAVPMTNNNGFATYEIDGSKLSVLGEYNGYADSLGAGEYGYVAFKIEVSLTGDAEFTTAEGVAGTGLMFFILFVGFIITMGGFAITKYSKTQWFWFGIFIFGLGGILILYSVNSSIILSKEVISFGAAETTDKVFGQIQVGIRIFSVIMLIVLLWTMIKLIKGYVKGIQGSEDGWDGYDSVWKRH